MRRITTLTSKLESSPNEEALALDLTDVKLQRKVSNSSLDVLFVQWIRAAATVFEAQTDRQVMTALWEYALERFPSSREIELPKPPLQAVISIVYLDENEEEQTMDAADYDVVTPAGPYASRGRIVLTQDASWPTTLCRTRAVRITFRAGYADTSRHVPFLVKQCLMWLVGDFHRYGEETQDAALHPLPSGAARRIAEFRETARERLAPEAETW
jgi:uncharacterized phiE125 gp8 family phage protein